MSWLRFGWTVGVLGLVAMVGEPDAALCGASVSMEIEIRNLDDRAAGVRTHVNPRRADSAATPVTRGCCGMLHYRCGSYPSPESDPIPVVRAMFAAFQQRDPGGWVEGMASDYRFDSDDPAFRLAHPDGFTRCDEYAFARHLFRGGGEPPGGRRRPIVTRVDAPVGAVLLTLLALGEHRATVLVEGYAYTLRFDDGSRVQVSGTVNTLELILRDGAWRVLAWHEHVPAAGASAAANPAADSAATATQTASADDVPARLAIRPRGIANGSVLAFELDLPRRGGVLELFDVMGRRITRRDLDALLPGVRRIELPASGIPTGTYWARVQQGGTMATTRIVRLH
ncbi:MAG: hypothetical protein U0704_10100 [Candidatus Eisenbacteria bacterium]